MSQTGQKRPWLQVRVPSALPASADWSSDASDGVAPINSGSARPGTPVNPSSTAGKQIDLRCRCCESQARFRSSSEAICQADAP
jgi:hypothetical protein